LNELMEKSMSDLRELAKSMDIKSYYKYKKDELVSEILKKIEEAKIAQGIITPPPVEEKKVEVRVAENEQEEVFVKKEVPEKPLNAWKARMLKKAAGLTEYLKYYQMDLAS